MAKKKSSLKIIFIAFIIFELILVILSSNFQRKLEIGFDSGKFVIRNIENRYDLQVEITKNFQKDEFLRKSNELKTYEILDYNKFQTALFAKNEVSDKIFSLMKPATLEQVKNSDLDKDDIAKGSLINELNEKVINNEEFIEPGFSKFLDKDDPEQAYLIDKISNGTKLSPLDIARINRIILEKSYSGIIEHQKNVPQIYGSFEMYDFFRNIFSEASALGAFNLIRMLLIVDLIFLMLVILIRKKLSHIPSSAQLVVEMIYGTFDDFVKDTVGKDRTYFTPYIVTIFLFVLICNIIGMVPIPGFMEPTRNLNVPLGLGIIAIIVVHFTAIKVKGLWPHLENYVNPIKNPLAALDIVSEASKVVSISFRLFGNILGGAIIIVVVSSLVKFIVLPVGLNMFFGLFVGTIQAFVFTMLALTYIGVEITE